MYAPAPALGGAGAVVVAAAAAVTAAIVAAAEARGVVALAVPVADADADGGCVVVVARPGVERDVTGVAAGDARGNRDVATGVDGVRVRDGSTATMYDGCDGDGSSITGVWQPSTAQFSGWLSRKCGREENGGVAACSAVDGAVGDRVWVGVDDVASVALAGASTPSLLVTGTPCCAAVVRPATRWGDTGLGTYNAGHDKNSGCKGT